jgi:hypothetical protein
MFLSFPNFEINPVDRLPLVSSAIINVAQDVDEPWPLEVIGHDGKAYNVTMEPGDLVLYESHSIIHGKYIIHDYLYFIVKFLTTLLAMDCLYNRLTFCITFIIVKCAQIRTTISIERSIHGECVYTFRTHWTY